jgi:hypothetical protein
MVDKSYRELLDEVQLLMHNAHDMNNILIERCRVLEEANHQLRKDKEELETSLVTANNLIDSMEEIANKDLYLKALAVIEKKKAEILDLQETCRRQQKLIHDNLGPDNC